MVAMVTNTMEGGQKKCEHYWPEQGTKEYGPFKVTLTDQQVFADYTIRQLFVSVSLGWNQCVTAVILCLLFTCFHDTPFNCIHQCDKVGGTTLKVTQFHFTSWPDHGVPEYAGPILNYLRRMKAQMKLFRGPTLVHCRSVRVG